MLKGCPLLVQKETSPSLTVAGESHTYSAFSQCQGSSCAAYSDGICKMFETKASTGEEDDDE